MVGGGAAGLSAALAAARARRRRRPRRRGTGAGRAPARRGRRGAARELAARAAAAGVELLENAPALGAFDGLVPIWQGSTLHQVRARGQVFATGAIEQPLVFPGNDLPGRDALRRRPPPGGSATPSSRAPARWWPPSTTVASAPRWRCSRPAWRSCVADLRPEGAGGAGAASRRRHGVEVLNGATVLEARGRNQLQRRRARSAGGGGRRRAQIGCDLLVVVRRQRPGHLAASPQSGGRTVLRQRARPLRARRFARRGLRGGRGHRQGRCPRRPSCRARSRAPRPRTSLGLGDARRA